MSHILQWCKRCWILQSHVNLKAFVLNSTFNSYGNCFRNCRKGIFFSIDIQISCWGERKIECLWWLHKFYALHKGYCWVSTWILRKKKKKNGDSLTWITIIKACSACYNLNLWIDDLEAVEKFIQFTSHVKRKITSFCYHFNPNLTNSSLNSFKNLDKRCDQKQKLMESRRDIVKKLDWRLREFGAEWN